LKFAEGTKVSSGTNTNSGEYNNFEHTLKKATESNTTWCCYLKHFKPGTSSSLLDLLTDVKHKVTDKSKMHFLNPHKKKSILEICQSE
jgi:hypothetical protein